MSKKIKIMILFGGRSGEHEVSLISAASVVRHLSSEKYEVLLAGIDHDGRWWLQDSGMVNTTRQGGVLGIVKSNGLGFFPGLGFIAGNPENNQMTFLNPDVVFPVLHGTFGEDGTIQGLLETMNLPYVGCTVLGSALGMDKEKVKRVWLQGGLPVVPFRTLEKKQFHQDKSFELWADVTRQFGNEIFVKPARGGSSVGISRAVSQEGFAAALVEAFRFDTKILIEPAISAREIEVSVIGNDIPQAFVPGEILPSHEFYDYEAKYQDPDGAQFIIPAAMDERSLSEARELALRAYSLCEATGLARVDFFLDKKTGLLLLNEINTMPGFTSISMFPRMCEADGLPYPALLDELVLLGLKEHERKQNLVFSR